MYDTLWELRVAPKPGTPAVYYLERKPTKLQCQQLVYTNAGDTTGKDSDYTLRRVKNEGQMTTPLPR